LSVLPEKCIYRNIAVSRAAQLESKRQRSPSLAAQYQRQMRDGTFASISECGLTLAVSLNPIQERVLFHDYKLCH